MVGFDFLAGVNGSQLPNVTRATVTNKAAKDVMNLINMGMDSFQVAREDLLSACCECSTNSGSAGKNRFIP